MRLTASWTECGDPNIDAPNSINWEDGRRGTIDDLRAHNQDTYRLTHPEEGCTQRDIYPEIVAEVSFCEFGHRWGLKGDGVETLALPLTDPNATDQQIHSALFSLQPMQYRVNIRRK